MNEFYGQLSFITADPHMLSEKLKILSSDKSMCERVRVLTLWPSAARDAIKAIDHEKLSLHENGVVGAPPTRPGSYLNKIGGRIFAHTRSLSRTVVPRSQDSLLSPEDRMNIFLEVVNRLKNVEEFEINWYLDHGSKTSAWRVSFFPEIWQSIGHRLRRLTIDIQLFKLNDIIKSCGSMPHIQELNLTLRCDAAHTPPGDTVVPYFINKFSLTLKSLSIKTIGHQQLSTDFQLLGQFPHLRKLSLIMPLDTQHLSDPSGLEKLLHNHPCITDLCLRYSRCCGERSDDGFQSHLDTHRIYGAITLPALRALELGLHIPIPQCPTKNSMLHAISRMGTNLTSLTLVDRSLTLDEVKVLLRLFPSYRLRKLSLFARFLSPQLIDVIAQNCPDLSSLALDVQSVVKCEAAVVPKSGSQDSIGDFAQALFDYSVDLDNERWRYRTWALADISIMKWKFKVGHTYDWASMRALSLVVPAIRSFAGTGHTHEDRSLLPLSNPRRLVEIANRMKPSET